MKGFPKAANSNMNGLLKTTTNSMRNVAKNCVRQLFWKPAFVSISGIWKPFHDGKSSLQGKSAGELFHRSSFKVNI
jgi:hypothetical protein